MSVRRDGGRGKRAAVDPQSVQGVRWPNATIPYVFSSEIRESTGSVSADSVSAYAGVLLTHKQSGHLSLLWL